MKNLSDDATIYVKNKNEFDALVGMADSIPAAYKGKIKFVDDRISQEDNSVKLFSERFSMRSTVEETKNLIAVHNLKEEKLLSTLKLGGFPMPSIAITRSDIPHTNFGDICVL